MSEHDLDALESLLETHAAPHGGMSLEMLDGYLSALVVGPVPVSPGHYMDAIWGDGPQPDTGEEAQGRMSLVVALWNHIAWRVAQPLPDDDREHEPGDARVDVDDRSARVVDRRDRGASLTAED